MQTDEAIRGSLGYRGTGLPRLLIIPALFARLPVFAFLLAIPALGLEVNGLRAEHRVDPVGLDDAHPRLSWQMKGDKRGAAQTAYEVLAATTMGKLNPEAADLWKSGKVTSGDAHAFYDGKKLKTGQDVHWLVRIWDERNRPSPSSDPATWTCALMEGEQPVAQWISFTDETPFPTERQELHLPAPRYYRKDFEAKKKLKRAIVFASALGIYELHCNGEKVGDAFFAPGWTNYRKRAYYNTYDVTDQIRQGANAIGAVVADGWYAGYLGSGKLDGYGPHQTGRNIYGKTPAVMVQLQLEFEDGSLDTIMSDATWQVSTGPEFEADLLMGEGYDARNRIPGWSTSGFDATGWPNAILARDNGTHQHPFIDSFGNEVREFGFVKPPVMQAEPAQPVRITRELPARKIAQPRPGVYLFDLGQHIAGTIRLRTEGEAGQKLTIRYGETRHQDGRLMVENLRPARATDTYICSGDPAGETWMPRFTFHEFQFVEITGLAGKPDLDTVTGLVLHSDTPFASGFECSDPVVNRIFGNAVRTRRNERMGWRGDARISVGADAYHADVAAFYKKWLRELEEAMTPEGYYPSHAPYPFGDGEAAQGTAGSDAGIICPHALWMATGDIRFFTAHWPAMTRFMEARKKHDPKLTGTAFGAPRGDWLNVNDPTPHEFIDLCSMAQNCRLMTDMAKPDEKERYREWLEILKKNFLANHLQADGTIQPSSQTAYVLALEFDLVPQTLRAKAAGHLAELIRSKADPNSTGMTTGVLGTKPLLPVLSANGHHDLAVRLMQSRKFPSWGYQVQSDATTTWERWDLDPEDGEFTGADGQARAALNSFSHYNSGAVTEWMMSTLAGIQAQAPGYAQIRIVPQIPSLHATDETETISWVKAHHDSPHGRIAVHWIRLENGLDLAVTIPPNTTSTVEIPGAGKTLTESGTPAANAEGVTAVRFAGDRAVVEVQSGSYAFEMR